MKQNNIRQSEFYLPTKSKLFHILDLLHNSANFNGLAVTHFWGFSNFASLLLCGRAMPATHELTNKLSVYWKQLLCQYTVCCQMQKCQTN